MRIIQLNVNHNGDRRWKG